jgi:D-alanyl-D-alanine endopeptidase (penicillin-binding protein 7)
MVFSHSPGCHISVLLIMKKTVKFIAHSIVALMFGTAISHAAADTARKASAPGLKKVSRASAANVADFGRDGGPNLLSHAALVFDQETGQAIYSKNAENALPIASITKLMTSMVVLDAKLDLEEAVVIDKADIDTLKNSSSRLPVGTVFRREDLMRLALMASDNRAAAALGRTYPGGSSAFVEAMNAKAKLLGLNNAHFVDPTGLAPGNVASPQDLAVMVSAASAYPEIREFSTTQALNVTLPSSSRKIGFVNTNALVRTDGWKIGLSKTGFINEAGKCLVMQAIIASRPVVIVLMDSLGKFTRIGDANRIKKWIESGKYAAALPAKIAAPS